MWRSSSEEVDEENKVVVVVENFVPTGASTKDVVKTGRLLSRERTRGKLLVRSIMVCRRSAQKEQKNDHAYVNDLQELS